MSKRIRQSGKLQFPRKIHSTLILFLLTSLSGCSFSDGLLEKCFDRISEDKAYIKAIYYIYESAPSYYTGEFVSNRCLRHKVFFSIEDRKGLLLNKLEMGRGPIVQPGPHDSGIDLLKKMGAVEVKVKVKPDQFGYSKKLEVVAVKKMNVYIGDYETYWFSNHKQQKIIRNNLLDDLQAGNMGLR